MTLTGRMPSWAGLFLVASAIAGPAVGPAQAQTGRHVLLVANADSPASIEIAEHYAQARSVPAEQVLRLPMRFQPRPDAAGAEPDEISRADYERQIETPVSRWLAEHSAQDRILFLVLAKGVPLRIGGTSGAAGTGASVDSELALLYRKMARGPAPPAGRVENPYFVGDADPAAAPRFTHEAFDVYLVTRLDGFTTADAKALVDRARSPARQGRVVLDMKAADGGQGDAWLAAAAKRLGSTAQALEADLETTSAPATGRSDILGHYWWASNDPAVTTRVSGLGFAPGAISASYVSTDGRTFREPPPSWTLGRWDRRDSYWQGSPQSLAGDLVREGITGIAAQVAEPLLDGAVRPQALFPAYAAGFTLAEAFYLATPFLSWQTIVVGDPLCRIADRSEPAPSSIDGGIDAQTELPTYFAARRLEGLKLQARLALQRQRTAPAARVEVEFDARGLALALRGESRLARGDTAGARQALEDATAIEPRLNGSQLALAAIHEAAGEHGKAEERYRQVLVSQPDDLVALNNLAYSLAVRSGRPAEALPIAERALVISKGTPVIADTLGWVHYLLGNTAQATRLIDAAARALPGHAEIRYHAAVLAAERADRDRARSELAEALRLDPSLGTRSDIRDLAGKLGIAVPGSGPPKEP